MSIVDNGDYGFLVSQLGIDVTAAADQQLISNSSWRNMMIEHTDSVTIAASGSISYTHDLEYPPVLMVYLVSSGETHLSSNDYSASITSTSITINNLTGASATFRYYIYRIPLNQNFSAPIYKPSDITAVQKDKDIGIKVLKSGKKYTSTDLRDYNFHSGTRSPMIHSVVYGTTTSTSFTDPDGNSQTGDWIRYTNNLGYVPIFLGFFSADNVTWSPLFGLEQSPPKLFVWTTGDMGINTLSAGQYGTIIAFKDPYSVGEITTVRI